MYDEEFENALAESDGDIEYAAFAEHHHFVVPKGSHWNDVRETTVNVGVALQDASCKGIKSKDFSFKC